MANGRRILAGVFAATLLGTPALPLRADPAPSPPAHAGTDGMWGFFDKYCQKCHNAEDWAGGVAFDTLSEQDIPQQADVMEKVVRKLRGQMMPPGGNKMPDRDTRIAFVSWMENNLDVAGKAHPNPGRVGLHRLNRKEYANAVKDLLNVDIDPASLLPRDEPRDGFDNVAQALQVTPSFLDQYISAARSVAVMAMGNKDAQPAGTTYRATTPSTQIFHEDGLPLGTRGGIAVDHNFPADGEYVLNIANMAVALWVYNMEFENHLIVSLDGEQIYETTIGGEDDMKAIDQKQDPAVEAINKRLKNIRFNAKAGVHRLVVAFRNRTFAESEDRLQGLVPGGGQDRILRVSSFEVRGPYNATGVSRTASRDYIFSCYPRTAAEEEPCARSIISRIAKRAFRRPVTDEDMAPLMRFYQTGRNASDFDSGVRRAITAVLAHPAFLYRDDEPSQPVDPGQTYALSDLQIASRLSFFLWSTLPDDELLDVASQGKLRDRTELNRQVKRMLADPRAKTLATNFGAQWLNLSKLAEITPEPSVFPYASGAGDLREDFKTELALFMDMVFRGDQSVLELLSSRYTFINERLALQYDINDVRGDQFRRVELKDSARWGLLGKGGVLMASSYPNRTSPVLRGNYVLERIMGVPPPIPPNGVPALEKSQEGAKKTLTVREMLEQHRQKPQCFSCHIALDPLGFVLEGFDATGKRRPIDRYARTEIDTLGTLPDGTVVRGPDDLREALMNNPTQFVQNLTERLLIYGLGRPLEAYDMPMVRDVVRKSASDNYRFSTLIMNIVTSDAFQKARMPDENANKPLIKQAAVTR